MQVWEGCTSSWLPVSPCFPATTPPSLALPPSTQPPSSTPQLSDPGVGRIDIQYRRVECAVPEDMKVSVMDYAGPGGWLRLAIDQAGGRAAVASVAVQGADGGDWKPLDHSWGATWELSSAPRPPLSFKVARVGG